MTAISKKDSLLFLHLNMHLSADLIFSLFSTSTECFSFCVYLIFSLVLISIQYFRFCVHFIFSLVSISTQYFSFCGYLIFSLVSMSTQYFSFCSGYLCNSHIFSNRKSFTLPIHFYKSIKLWIIAVFFSYCLF